MARPQSARFELGRRLGAGSIGVVFEARERERDRLVALKQLRALTATGVAHLRREFQILERLSHPNIVELYDIALDDVPPFITMELISGQDFLSYVRKRPLSPGGAPLSVDDSVRIDTGAQRPQFAENVFEDRLRKSLGQAAQALCAIHEAGVVHRDLKPSNILVTTEGRVVVMDFSIAVEARNQVEDLTCGGVLIGTLEYMAPEQAAGDPLTPRADWYALGVVMYQALTGRLPFDGSRSQVLERKQAYDPQPVSELVDGVPDDLAALCAALLTRRPHERPSGDEIARRLGVATTTADPIAQARRLERVPFTGRERELGLLERAWERVLAGAGAGALVTGGPGMGKTRLAREFADRLGDTDAALVLGGSCHSVDGRSYNALDEIIDSSSRILASSSADRIQAVLPAGAEFLPRMFPALSRVPGLDQIARRPRGDAALAWARQGALLAGRARAVGLAVARARAVDALRDLLSELARRRPVLLWIDDAQWADRDSVELLCDLFCATPPERVFLLLCLDTANIDTGGAPKGTSSANDPRASLLLAADGAGWARVEVGELAPDARQRIRDWVRGDPSRAAAADAPADQATSAGCPRVIIEQLRDAPAAPADSGVEPIFRRRAGALTSRGRALLEALVLVGRPAPLSLLARSVDLSMSEREPAAGELEAAGLARWISGSEPWLDIACGQLADLVRSSLSAERRVELALRLAMALQRSGDADSAELGARWRDARDLARAFPYFEQSARSLRERFAFHRAVAGYRAALETLPGTKQAERLASDLVSDLAETLAAAERYLEAADLATRTAQGAFSAAHVRAVQHRLRGGAVTAALDELAAFASGLGVAPHRPSRPLTALAQRARLSWRRRRYQPRGESEVAARDLDTIDAVRALSAAALFTAPDQGAALQAEHVLVALSHGERRRVARALAGDLLYALVRDRPDPTRILPRWEELAQQATEYDEPYTRAVALLGAGLLHTLRGQLPAADERLAEAVATLSASVEIDASWELLTAQFLHCGVRIARGDARARDALVARVLDRATRTGDAVGCALFAGAPNIWRLMAADRVPSGLTLIDQLLCEWTDPRAYLIRAWLLLGRAMGQAYLHRPDDARAALDQCDAAVGGRSLRYRLLCATEVLCVRARVAVLAGDQDALARTAAALERLDAGVASGHAAAVRGALAGAANDRSTAVSSLHQAIARFDESGAVPFAMGARARLAPLVTTDERGQLERVVAAWCEHQAIANPARIFDYLCPWFSRDTAPRGSDAL